MRVAAGRGGVLSVRWLACSKGHGRVADAGSSYFLSNPFRPILSSNKKASRKIPAVIGLVGCVACCPKRRENSGIGNRKSEKSRFGSASTRTWSIRISVTSPAPVSTASCKLATRSSSPPNGSLASITPPTASSLHIACYLSYYFLPLHLGCETRTPIPSREWRHIQS